MMSESPNLVAWRRRILKASISASLTEQKPTDPKVERIKPAELSLIMPPMAKRTRLVLVLPSKLSLNLPGTGGDHLGRERKFVSGRKANLPLTAQHGVSRKTSELRKN